MKEKIDFVIPWVDGSNIEWLKEKNKYSNTPVKIDACRYRDWGLLKYWFRGVEKFAPWVNKIYFVTWGHLPEWLNTSNEKLVVVNHKDFIPSEYLPTFNSNTILLNIHRIKGLSENFVIFNDDFYLINNTKSTDFFINEKPCDNIALNVHCPLKSQLIHNFALNNAGIINEHFAFKESIKKNFTKWFNIGNGKEIIRTIILMGCPRFPGFYYHHLPQGYKKSTFYKIWDLEYKYLDKTSKNKFRTAEDASEWLMKDWQIVEGNIVIRRNKLGKVFNMDDNLMPKQGESILKFIRRQKGKCIAINDSEKTGEKSKEYMPKITEEFDRLLPQKSTFEK